MNLIDERNKRTVRRKIAKKKYDEIITLSVGEATFQRVRLLDEGAVVMADGQIDFYIAKGTLEKYLNALPDDYEGTINMGHIPFAELPIGVIGTWHKSDLHLVDIGDGRKGLDVDLRLTEGHPFVTALKMAPYTVGVSAEFAYHVDEDATKELGVEIIDDIFIKDFAVVGEAGNVGSSDIQLKGGTKVTLKELNQKLGLEPEEVAEEVAEDVTEEVTEETTEEAEETEEVTEEAEDESENMLSLMSDVIETMKAKIDVLTEQVVALTAEKEKSQKALSAQLEKEKKFDEKFKELYASIAEEKPVVEKQNGPAYTDGIGDI